MGKRSTFYRISIGKFYTSASEKARRPWRRDWDLFPNGFGRSGL